MTTILITLAIFLFVILIMSVGVMAHGRRLRGSCGGVAGVCACKNAQAITCDTRKDTAHSGASS